MANEKANENERESKENTLPSSSVGDSSPEIDSNKSKQHAGYKKSPPGESRRRWGRFSWQGLLSIVIILIYSVQAYFMWGQLSVMSAQLAEMRTSSTDTKVVAEAAKQSAQVAERTLVLSQRPWVSVGLSIAEPLVFDSNGARTLLRFTMKNLGHSPAVFVNMHFVAFSMQNLWDELTKRKEICTRIQEWDKGEFSEMILPGGQSEEGRPLRIKKVDIDKNTIQIPGGPSVVTLAVVGCVDYQFTFAKEHHQTEFSFVAVQRGPIAIIDPTQEMYPVEKIEFVSSGGSYAN
jgi:hypothetical protein